jgi:hypothetical protein
MSLLVGTLSGHGFHPLKAQLTLSTHEPQLVRPRGALQAHVRFEPQADIQTSLALAKNLEEF